MPMFVCGEWRSMSIPAGGRGSPALSTLNTSSDMSFAIESTAALHMFPAEETIRADVARSCSLREIALAAVAAACSRGVDGDDSQEMRALRDILGAVTSAAGTLPMALEGS